MKADLERIREHLANERTFLAWLRTAIGIIVFGFAVARFALAVRQLGGVEARHVTSTDISLWLGNTAILLGIVVIAAALFRFRRIQRELEMGRFETSNGLLVLVTLVTAMFGVALVFYLLVIQQRVG